MTTAGVEPSFDEYVVARSGALMRSAWLLTGERRQAEELVRISLGRACQHWRRVAEQEDGLYDAYVRRTMMASYLRRWRRHRWSGEPARPGPGPGDMQRNVAAALSVLTRAQRAVVVLRFFEGLTESQTAEVLDCTVATVRRRTARALTALGETPLLGTLEHAGV